MASRALLLKQPILSVMHQVCNTNTSRSCGELLTQSSLPPGTQTKLPLVLPSCLPICSRIAEESKEERILNLCCSQKTKVNSTVGQLPGKISLSVLHCKHAPYHS